MNPIYERLAKPRRWLGWRAAVGTAIVLGSATLAIGLNELDTLLNRPVISGMTAPPAGSLITEVWLLAVTWLTALIAPAAAAAIAAVLTGRTLHSEAFKLLKLTPLLPAQIAGGFLMAALYRIRMMLGVLIGLLPLLVLSPVAISVYTARYNAFYGYATGEPSWAEVLGIAAVYLALALSVLTMTLFGATLGVLRGVDSGKPFANAATAALLSLILTFTGTVGMLTLVGPVLGGMPPDVFWRLLGLSVGLCLLPSTLLTLGAWWQARRAAGGRLP